MKNTFKTFMILSAFVAASAFIAPRPALASGLCESASSAEDSFNDMNQDIVDDYNNALEQIQWFIDLKLMDTAKQEMMERLDEFQRNFGAGFKEWWHDNDEGDDPEPKGLYEHLKPFTQQLAQARIEQTLHLGQQVDAQIINETALRLQEQRVKAQETYAVNKSACQVDTMGAAQSAAQTASRAVARGFTMDNQQRTLNSRPSGPAPTTPGAYRDQYNIAKAASISPAAEQAAIFKEYQDYFCDPANGGQGCTTAGPLAGKNTDLGGLLWGNKQSAKLDNSPEGENNRRIRNAVLRTMISPRTAPPVPKDVTEKTPGQEEILRRRAHAARVNTIYNVVSQILADRVESSAAGITADEIRTASGVDPSDASVSPSYREIQEAMSRDRFVHPEYTSRLLGSPTEIAREEVGVNAVRMQQMNDLYKRLEEMVFMEAAVYAEELDGRMPGDDTRDVQTRQ